jgi:hypothetical protein
MKAMCDAYTGLHGFQLIDGIPRRPPHVQGSGWLNATCHERTHFADALWCDNPTIFVVASGFCFRGAYVDFWKEFIEVRP